RERLAKADHLDLRRAQAGARRRFGRGKVRANNRIERLPRSAVSDQACESNGGDLRGHAVFLPGSPRQGAAWAPPRKVYSEPAEGMHSPKLLGSRRAVAAFVADIWYTDRPDDAGVGRRLSGEGAMGRPWPGCRVLAPALPREKAGISPGLWAQKRPFGHHRSIV